MIAGLPIRHCMTRTGSIAQTVALTRHGGRRWRAVRSGIGGAGVAFATEMTRASAAAPAIHSNRFR